MARQRMIHPDFFTDERVVSVSLAAQKLFVGLWCWADREGRMERNPLRLKMQVFPAEAFDVAPLLVELEAVGLIQSYSVGGKSYLLVLGFKKRQKPHPNEAASVIPPPPGEKPQENVTSPSHQNASPREMVGSNRAESESESESVSKPSAPPIVRPAGGVGDLREGIERLWKKHRGSPWVWKYRDEEALRPAFDLAGGDLQLLLRVFESGLQKTFPRLTKLSHLTEHWNDYAATKGPEPQRMGRASSRDTDWSDVEQPDVPDTLETFQEAQR